MVDAVEGRRVPGGGTTKLFLFQCILISYCWICSIIVGCEGATFNVLALQSLSYVGNRFGNEDIYSSFTALPYALKHFNERDGTILPFLRDLKGCNAKLN